MEQYTCCVCSRELRDGESFVFVGEHRACVEHAAEAQEKQVPAPTKEPPAQKKAPVPKQKLAPKKGK